MLGGGLPELPDLRTDAIDAAAGEKLPRKGGPGITQSDPFVSKKTDLAPYVGADLAVIKADTQRMRTGPKGLRPYVTTNLKTRSGFDTGVRFIELQGLLVE